MDRETTLLKEYRLAGPEMRLSLYLDHPPLREDFIAIEQGDEPADALSRRVALEKKTEPCAAS